MTGYLLIFLAFLASSAGIASGAVNSRHRSLIAFSSFWIALATLVGAAYQLHEEKLSASKAITERQDIQETLDRTDTKLSELTEINKEISNNAQEAYSRLIILEREASETKKQLIDARTELRRYQENFENEQVQADRSRRRQKCQELLRPNQKFMSIYEALNGKHTYSFKSHIVSSIEIDLFHSRPDLNIDVRLANWSRVDWSRFLKDIGETNFRHLLERRDGFLAGVNAMECGIKWVEIVGVECECR